MFCIYCGAQTDNANKICSACAITHTAAPTSDAAPIPAAPVENAAPSYVPVEPTPSYAPTEPAPSYASSEPAAPSYAPTEPAAPSYAPTESAPFFAGENIAPAPAPSMEYYMPVQAVPSVSATDANALIVKEAMGSIPALLAAIFLTGCAVLNIVASGFSGTIWGMLFTVNILFILAAAGAWISFGTAKRADKLPVTAGLKMESALSIVYTVLMGIVTFLFLIIGIVVLVAGNYFLTEVIYEYDLDAYAPILTVLGSAIGFIFLAAAALCILFIVFYALTRSNLNRMRLHLIGKGKKNLNIFAIVVTLLYGGLVIINGIDVLIANAKIVELFASLGIDYSANLYSTFAGICGGVAAICGAVAQLQCRKKLSQVQ